MTKSSLDFDLEKVVAAIESIDNSEVLAEPIAYDEDDPDSAMSAFLDAVGSLTDEEVESLENSADIVELFNSAPARFYETDDSGASDEDNSDDSDEDTNDDDTSDEQGEDQGEGSDDEDTPDDQGEESGDDAGEDDINACPNFGMYDPDVEDCDECSKDFPDEYKRCKAVTTKDSKEENPKGKQKKEEKSKPVKEEKTRAKEKKEGKPAKEEKAKTKEKPAKEEKVKAKPAKPPKVKEEEPKEEEKGKRGRPKKEEAKGSFRKGNKEEVSGKEERPGRKPMKTVLTGRMLSDFFRRISAQGLIKDCLLDCTPDSMSVRAMSPSGGIFATVKSSFGIGYDGTLGIGDISKIIKFCSNVGDGEVAVEVTNERIIFKAGNTKIKLLLIVPDTVQCVPSEEMADIKAEDLVSACDVSTVITGEIAKAFTFNSSLIKSDVLTITFEDNQLSFDGGLNTTDKFSINLGEPVFEEGASPVYITVTASYFASCLTVLKNSEKPIELMISTDGEDIVVIRNGEDTWAFSSNE